MAGCLISMMGGCQGEVYVTEMDKKKKYVP